MLTYRNEIGNSGIFVSPIGLGTVKFGRNEGVKYPTTFALPSIKIISHLIELAETLGVNLLDTAPAYGISEERLGRVLQGKRHKWVISTKAGEHFTHGQSHFNFSPDHLVKSVECSLQRLRTDYLDILLLHSCGDDQRIIEEEEAFITCEKLKRAGKIRLYGMSTKTLTGGYLTIDYADLAMINFNPLLAEERVLIQYAKEKKRGIFIKKALLSGHFSLLPSDDPIRCSLDFISKERGVTSIIIGTINAAHLKQNIAIFNASYLTHQTNLA